VKEQKDEKEKMKQNHKRELEEQKTTIEANKNHEILRIKEEFLEILEGRKKALATAEHKYNLETQEHEIRASPL
jgi:hypothetical protein